MMIPRTLANVKHTFPAFCLGAQIAAQSRAITAVIAPGRAPARGQDP